eukprot:1160684-Pelagomonas_calceolata.AAC.10
MQHSERQVPHSTRSHPRFQISGAQSSTQDAVRLMKHFNILESACQWDSNGYLPFIKNGDPPNNPSPTV